MCASVDSACRVLTVSGGWRWPFPGPVLWWDLGLRRERPQRGLLEPEAEARPRVGGGHEEARSHKSRPRSTGRLPLQHCGLWLDRQRLHGGGPEVHPPRTGNVSFWHHTPPARKALRRRQRGEAAGHTGSRVPLVLRLSCALACMSPETVPSQHGAKAVSQTDTSSGPLCPTSRGPWPGMCRAGVLGQHRARWAPGGCVWPTVFCVLEAHRPAAPMAAQ